MHLIVIGAGGFAGAILRYLVSAQFAGIAFPGGTFVVNAVGCFCMGLATGFGDLRGWPSRETHLLITTGLLGGFTTFSAFGHETVLLLQADAVKGTVISAIHVVVAVAAVAAGRTLAAVVFRTA